MTLVPDERTLRRFGDHSLVYLRATGANGEGGYEVRFSDGRRVRVIPDGTRSTRARLHACSAALQALDDGDPDPFVYLIGALTTAGLEWEVTE